MFCAACLDAPFRMTSRIEYSGRGRDGSSSVRTRTAPRTDPGVRSCRTGLLPRVSGVKAMTGPRINNANRRDPAHSEAVHALPIKSMPLTAPQKRAKPAFNHGRSECINSNNIARHPVIRGMTANHGCQPTPLHRDRLMTAATQFHRGRCKLQASPSCA